MNDTDEQKIKRVIGKLKPIKSFNMRRTSYGLKHMIERKTDIYMTNIECINAMRCMKFKTKTNENNLAMYFNVSERSITAAGLQIE